MFYISYNFLIQLVTELTSIFFSFLRCCFDKLILLSLINIMSLYNLSQVWFKKSVQLGYIRYEDWWNFFIGLFVGFRIISATSSLNGVGMNGKSVNFVKASFYPKNVQAMII